jgi:hypothetical protein
LRERIGRTDGARGVLELEAVAEDEGVPLITVLPKILLELGGRLRLDVADPRAKGVADAKQALVSATIPGLVGDRSWSEQGNTKVCSDPLSRIAAWTFVGTAALGKEKESRDRDVEASGKVAT